MPLVGTKEILNEECEIHADKYGRWSIKIATGEEGKLQELGGGDTLDKAIASARITLNKQRIEVHVIFYDMQGGERGVATKIHAKTRNVMARVGRESRQMSTSTAVFKGDTPKMARDKYFKLQTEQRRIGAEMRKIADQHSMRLGDAVNKAIVKAIEDQS
jgi:hypothetical protein